MLFGKSIECVAGLNVNRLTARCHGLRSNGCGRCRRLGRHQRCRRSRRCVPAAGDTCRLCRKSWRRGCIGQGRHLDAALDRRDRASTGAIRPTRLRPSHGVVYVRSRFDRRRRGRGFRGIIEIERRAVEACNVSTASGRHGCQNNNSASRRVHSPRPAAAGNTRILHGTHLYSHHPLTFIRLMRG